MSNCPIDGYDGMTVSDVESSVLPYTNGVEALTDPKVVERLDMVKEILSYEEDTKNRKTAKSVIKDVRDELKTTAVKRELLTREEKSDVTGETNRPGEDADSDPDDGMSGSLEDENERERGTEDDTEEPSEFVGADGKTRSLIRNPSREGEHIAGFSWRAGEVKEIVMNDRLRAALKRNKLQLVSNRA
jgi:hypothetical protein